ncbi:MAG: TonB-dependent siderophore receptor [Rhodocyclaceae bacterium]
MLSHSSRRSLIRFSPRPMAVAVHLACAGALWGAPVAMPVAFAQQAAAERAYDIPAGPLAATLNRFAQESGVFLAVTADQTQGKTSPGLHGRYVPAAGLQALLAGTNLLAVERSPGTFALRVVDAGAADDGKGAALAAVKVTAAATNDGSTEGTGSYTGNSASTSTGLALSLRETPQSISVVTRQRMDDQGLTQLTDVIKQVPGLTLSQTGDVGSDSSTIYSRGFAVENYQIDGVTQTYSNYSSIFQSTDMAIYDRVEVVRGANGLMSGVGAPGATINLVRKRPTEDFQASAKIETGSWNYFRVDADLSSKLNQSGSVRGRMVAASQDSDSYIDRRRERKDLFYGIVEADLTERTLATVGFSWQSDDITGHARSGRPLFYADGTPAHWARSDSAAANWAYSKRSNTTVFAAVDQNLGGDWHAKLTLTRAQSKYDEKIGYAAKGFADPATGAGMGLWAGRWEGQPMQDNVNLAVNGPFSLFGRKHEAVIGMSASRTHDLTPTYGLWSFSGWSSDIPDIFSWDGNTPAEPYNPQSGDSRTSERVTSAFAAARLRPTDKLSFIGGARTTTWRNQSWSNDYASNSASSSDRGESGQVSPFFGVVYDIDRNWSVYGSYTNIFKPQSNMDVEGNYLDPLLGNNYELGAKGAFMGGRLNVGAAIYQVEQDNFAVAEPGLYAPDGSQAYRAESGTKTRGFELEASGEIMRDWQVSAGFARNLVQDSQGLALNTQIPRNTAKLFTSYRIAAIGNGLTVGGGLTWQGMTYSDNIRPNNVRFEQGSYTVVDVMARYPITQKVAVSLNVYNLFDKKYYTSTSSAYYGAPRYVRAGLDVKF